MNLIDLFHQKLELFRLEKKYIRGRSRRTTFVSEAQYVDGEYIYSPRSSKYSAGNSDSEAGSDKARRRRSKMGLDMRDWRKSAGFGDRRVDVRWGDDFRS
ncbi:hypothetical protein M430DRAFT_148133 [Amorphotheca resinae ATCC 22711]|jgi:hypothetical protein|uniref:Uncharacterized protein n=1 Tax=Amorphotheca resinae ATCC 22711 TaxID=857342 RepID=A0A2T3APW6_AMORE|nr:hypothetical protein M430DRAFT_148133 [Amorphotheca resinae ATCC 22711]PSS07046.1 hypothetical protein M430DRAFT_148133 [Amorphotheca resinae ATCC 22711]